MTRPQDKNLRPGEYKLTLEEQKRGAQKSAEARRQKKTLKQYAESLLSCIVKDEKLERQLQKLGMSPDDGKKYTFYEAMIIGQIAQAVKGNTSAYNAIKDTVEPKDGVVGANVEDLSPLADLLRIDKKDEDDDE